MTYRTLAWSTTLALSAALGSAYAAGCFLTLAQCAVIGGAVGWFTARFA